MVAPIHPKTMPVILNDEGEERWLAGEMDDLIASFPSQLMSIREHVTSGKDTPDEVFTTGGDADPVG